MQNRAKIYGDEKEEDDYGYPQQQYQPPQQQQRQARNNSGPVPARHDYRGAQKFPLNEPEPESNDYYGANTNNNQYQQYGAPQQTYTTPAVAAQIYPPQPAAPGYGYPAQQQPHYPPIVASVSPYQQQFNPYGAPVTAPAAHYNAYSEPQYAAQQQPSQPQYNPYTNTYHQPQQQPQYNNQDQYSSEYTATPPQANPTTLQHLLNNNTQSPLTNLHSPLSETLDTPPQSYDKPHQLTSMTSSQSFAFLGGAVPPPPAHSPSPEPTAVAARLDSGAGRGRRPERGESAVASAARLAQQQPQHQLADGATRPPPRGASTANNVSPRRPAHPHFVPTIDSDEQDSPGAGSEDIVSTYMDGESSSDDDSELRAPDSNSGFHDGRDHTVARRIDPAQVPLGAPVRRASAGQTGRKSPEDKRKEFEERELANRSGSAEVDSGNGRRVPPQRGSSEVGSVAPGEGGLARRPTRPRTGTEPKVGGAEAGVGRPRNGEEASLVRPRSHDRDLSPQQQQQQIRPRSNDREVSSQQHQPGHTPRARSVDHNQRQQDQQQQQQQQQDQVQQQHTPRARTNHQQQESDFPHLLSLSPTQVPESTSPARVPTDESEKLPQPDRLPRAKTNHHAANRLSRDYATADAGAGYALKSTVAAKRASREIDVSVARDRAVKRASGSGFEGSVFFNGPAGSASSASSAVGSDTSRGRSGRGSGDHGIPAAIAQRERSRERMGVYDSPTANALARDYATTQWDDLENSGRGRQQLPQQHAPVVVASVKEEPVHKAVEAGPPPGMSARAYYLARYGGANKTGDAAAAAGSPLVVSNDVASPVSPVDENSVGGDWGKESIAAARTRGRSRG
ncbi:UNVERIFIED_CONTAM: hypothetical protein HDU68_001389 [Siphonaria sp. JEL0065]|nr:hypothetical protein HDU68_001389 [Siphonaria sp. JEL0065]